MPLLIAVLILSLILGRELKGRSPSSSVSTEKGPTTQLTNVISCMDIPTTDKEQETKISEQPIMLGENSQVRKILMKLFHLCQVLARSSPSS